MTESFPRLEFLNHRGREPLAVHGNHVDDPRGQQLEAPCYPHCAVERVLTVPAAVAMVASVVYAPGPAKAGSSA